MGLQSWEIPNFGNFGTLNLGVPRQNDIWVLAPWLGIENTIRGKVVHGFPQVQAVVSIVNMCLPMHQNCSNYAPTNLLFGFCMSMWIIDSLVTRPSPHLGAPTRLSTLEVLQAKERTQTFYPFVVFTLDSHLSLSRSFNKTYNDHSWHLLKSIGFWKALALFFNIKSYNNPSQ